MVLGLLTMSFLGNPFMIFASANASKGGDGTSKHPFQSLEEVRQSLKRLPESSREAGVVVELAGTFHLKETAVFGPEASRVTFRGAKRGATLSGGVPIQGWRRDSTNGIDAISAPIPGHLLGRRSMQLFEAGGAGRRLLRPRFPSSGYLQVGELPPGAKEGEWNKGQNWFKFKGEDLRKFRNLNEVEMVVHHYWVTSRMPIESVDLDQKIVRSSKTSVWRLTDDYTGQGAPYWLDNVGEALTNPGEFYYDTEGGKLIVSPFGRISPEKASYVAPRLETVLRLEGADHVNLEGLRIEHTEFQYPADKSGDIQAAFSIPGALQIVGGSEVAIRSCKFQHLGTYGLEITGKATQAKVESCDFKDLGAGGIKIDHGTEATTVEDSIIQDIGVLYPSAIGIWIGDSGHNRVSHNLIERTGYTGISIGWTWGYGPSKAVANIIEDNIIRDIGQNLLSDMGGIYNLGVSPGTILRRNYIADVKSRGYGGWGIYLDEGSTKVLVEDNVVERTTTGGFHQHYGRDNLIRNNVFAFAGKDGQVIRSRKGDHLSFRFERNVVVWKPGVDLLGGGGKTYQNVDFERNLLWRVDGKGELPAGLSASNLLATPQIKFGPRGLEIEGKSPANGLGIVPFSLKGIGPRR